MSESEKTDQGAKRRLDFLSGLTLAVFSAVALVWVIPAAVPGEASRGEVAPSFFPNLTLGVILICSMAMVIQNRSALRDWGTFGGTRILIEVAGWAVVAVTIMVLLTKVGFVPASIFATAVATVVSRYRGRWWIPALIAISLPFLLRYAVQALFSIELP